ncbi:hypothetical protein AKJ16_DCAP09826 [Drosera capensis]
MIFVNDLTEILTKHIGPWLVLGDCNVFIYEEEKVGYEGICIEPCDDMKHYFAYCGLEDLHAVGCFRTWFNDQKLDSWMKIKFDRSILGADNRYVLEIDEEMIEQRPVLNEDQKQILMLEFDDHEKTRTRKWLFDHDMIDVDDCPISVKGFEDVDRLFIACSFATEVREGDHQTIIVFTKALSSHFSAALAAPRAANRRGLPLGFRPPAAATQVESIHS